MASVVKQKSVEMMRAWVSQDRLESTVCVL